MESLFFSSVLPIVRRSPFVRHLSCVCGFFRGGCAGAENVGAEGSEPALTPLQSFPMLMVALPPRVFAQLLHGGVLHIFCRIMVVSSVCAQCASFTVCCASSLLIHHCLRVRHGAYSFSCACGFFRGGVQLRKLSAQRGACRSTYTPSCLSHIRW